MEKEMIVSGVYRNIYNLLCFSPSQISAIGTQGDVLKGCP